MWSKISKRRRKRETKKWRNRLLHVCTCLLGNILFFPLHSVQIFKLEILSDDIKKEMFKCYAVYSDTDYTFTSLILL